MEKRFCDLCEAPAERDIHRLQTSCLTVVRDKQCAVTVNPVISFEGHPTGFSGPPDLCRACLVKLLSQLADAAQEGR